MASGDFLRSFFAGDMEPPASNPATFGVRNTQPRLFFDTTTQEGVVFSGDMPEHYGSGGVNLELHFTATSATSGTGAFDAAFEADADGGTDIDADSFATAKASTPATVPGTSGVIKVVTIAFSNSEIDGIAAGDAFRLRVRRDVANDNATGDLELVCARLIEA